MPRDTRVAFFLSFAIQPYHHRLASNRLYVASPKAHQGVVIVIRKTCMLLALAAQHLAANGADSSSQQDAQALAPALLNEITVTANRSGAVDIDQAAATVSVITADDIEQHNAKDIKDALRYEPGVNVRRSAYRPSGVNTTTGLGGNEGISIRGLGGNRVPLLEDGIPLPRAFSFGAGSSGRGAYADSDLYQRIEVLRGPASSLYGSDGLTGAVNFITKDPADLLGIFGKPNYFSFKSGYDSVDRSVGGTATAAFGGERFQGMLMLKSRQGHETGNKGDNDVAGINRTTPDPLNYDNRSALGKLVFKASPRDTFKLTLSTMENTLNSNGLSNLSSTVTDYRTSAKVTGNRVGLSYDHNDSDNTLFQKIHASAYYRQAETAQHLFEGGVTGGRPRARDVAYSDNTLGGGILAESNFDTQAFRHKLVYGIDASIARLQTTASGTGWNTCTGNQYCEHFPKTDYTVFGAYLQDEIRYNAFTMVPGLRFDAYRLTPQASAKYDSQAQANGQPAVASGGSALSPRLAFLYTVSPALIPYIQYARGFRAPSPDEVNSFFKNSGRGYAYQQISNPNLKPETSDSFELGLRGKQTLSGSTLRYSTAVFAGNYRNFIDRTDSGSGTAADPTTYQYANASRARIHGVEGRLDWMFKHGYTLRSGFAYTKGVKTNLDGSRIGLDSVSPLAVVLGLRYEPDNIWFVQSDLLYNAAKKTGDMEKPADYATSSFVVADLSAGYRFNRHTTLYAGIRNLFDRKYWDWNDIRGLSLSDSTPNLAAYTAPGRSFNVSLKFEY